MFMVALVFVLSRVTTLHCRIVVVSGFIYCQYRQIVSGFLGFAILAVTTAHAAATAAAAAVSIYRSVQTWSWYIYRTMIFNQLSNISLAPQPGMPI